MGNQWVLGLHLFFLGILVVATTYTCLGAQNLTASCHQRERLALLEFKHNMKDEFKMLSSWVGSDCCSWKGVHCDDATGNVVSLHLRGNYRVYMEYDLEEDYYLVGEKLNAHLAELSQLKHMDLSGNNFQGSRIPDFIGSFKQLSYLNLSHSGFSGIIPHHIGNLSNLKALDLYSAFFFLEANDMSWVSGLSSLEHLDLREVGLLQAKNLDMVLYMIPTLKYLSLKECRLSNVDLGLGLHLNSSILLPNIEHLDLSSNNFDGQLPHFFQNLTSLKFLDLSSYNLNLAWNSLNLLKMIPSLLELHLSRCGLHNAPFSPAYLNFSAHSKIQYLDLSENSIEGRFPSEVTNMASLSVLDLSYNSLNSSIPVMPNLLMLDISYNKFNHIALHGIWRHCHLKELTMSGNKFGEEMIGPSTNMSECSHYALEMLDSEWNRVNGPIPESLGRLTNLRVLNLVFNGLTGSIPKALERLRSLEILNLSDNDLTGPIPTFLGKLTTLDLSRNQFTGSIPTSLGRLASLQAFSAPSNLLNGMIPVSIGRLSKLVLLDLSNNSLEGLVSEAHFATLSMLKRLDITSNHKLIFNISQEWIPPFQLRSFQLGSCKIANGFPQWLQTQRKLEKLMMSNASLQGHLPTWLRKMPLIYYLDLSYNKLTGTLTNLPINKYSRYLVLHENFFNGSFPKSLCRGTLLQIFDISRNVISGNIPDCVENLHEMETFILSSNRMSGVLPSSLGNMSSSLKWLKINDNKFSGKLPRNLENFSTLRVFDLGGNKFYGNIPKWIGENLKYLIVLRLHKNNFTGRIPQSLCKCSYLQILDVAHNNLRGPIPHCIGELHGMTENTHEVGTRVGIYDFDSAVFQVLKGFQLEYTKTLDLVFNMDLSSNKLQGEIPREIVTLTLLVGLNLSHNHLSGSIPESIGNMKALFSLDFSDNQLTGMIPPSMAALNFLSSMNVSHNNLSGRIPTGNQLQTLNDPSIYAGNRDLCGAPLPNNCSNHETPPTTTSNNKHKDAHGPNNLWFYLDIIGGFATGFWGIIGVLLFKKQWRHKLFMIAEVTVDKVFVAVAVRVSKIKRGRESI
ncbi:putative non-specific serine/threonine protein kinase [Helianthus annuus]|nr:putative non-specific serine/threonine protein kinase [Helianthus annuus]